MLTAAGVACPSAGAIFLHPRSRPRLRGSHAGGQRSAALRNKMSWRAWGDCGLGTATWPPARASAGHGCGRVFSEGSAGHRQANGLTASGALSRAVGNAASNALAAQQAVRAGVEEASSRSEVSFAHRSHTTGSDLEGMARFTGGSCLTRFWVGGSARTLAPSAYALDKPPLASPPGGPSAAPSQSGRSANSLQVFQGLRFDTFHYTTTNLRLLPAPAVGISHTPAEIRDAIPPPVLRPPPFH